MAQNTQQTETFHFYSKTVLFLLTRNVDLLNFGALLSKV